jgi:hypothetical protein
VELGVDVEVALVVLSAGEAGPLASVRTSTRAASMLLVSSGSRQVVGPRGGGWRPRALIRPMVVVDYLLPQRRNKTTLLAVKAFNLRWPLSR